MSAKVRTSLHDLARRMNMHYDAVTASTRGRGTGGASVRACRWARHRVTPSPLALATLLLQYNWGTVARCIRSIAVTLVARL
jgi:hypothetical protein